jgi:hypothetical protein
MTGLDERYRSDRDLGKQEDGEPGCDLDRAYPRAVKSYHREREKHLQRALADFIIPALPLTAIGAHAV